jgi:hypothetical protein
MRKHYFFLLLIILSILSCKPSIEDKYSDEKNQTQDLIESLDSTDSRILQNSIVRLKKENANLNKMTYLQILNSGKEFEVKQQKIKDLYKDNVDVVKYYIENKYNNDITDENGIPQKYEVKKEYLSKTKIFEKMISGIDSDETRILSYQTIVKYSLFLNGKPQGEMNFKGYLLESQHYSQGIRSRGILDTSLDYTPELDSEEDKKNIIRSWTNPIEGNLYVQTATEALYKSGMIKK